MAATILLLCAGLTSAGHAQVICCDFPTYATGTWPLQFATADLDGDGDLDLATPNHLDHTVSILINHGDGTFATHVPYAVDEFPWEVAAADLDGDGDIDLAVANSGASGPHGDNVSVLLNNGNGTFAPQVVYGVGNDPLSVVAADLDGDGDFDLATCNHASEDMSVLLNNGNGTFAPKVTYATGDNPHTLVAADLDGDGDMDLAVTNSGSDGGGDDVSILLNNGDATFAAQVAYAAGNYPGLIVAADLDGDGDVDLAVTNFFSHDVSVLLNIGNGTFATQVRYGVGVNPNGITAADVDGDGDRDLALTTWGNDEISVLLNAGNATFPVQTLLCAGDGPHGIVAADLSGDGKLDVAVSNEFDGNVEVILGISALLAGGPCPTSECGNPSAGSCFVVHSGPSCDDFGCCDAVCVTLPSCCNAAWEAMCVDKAFEICDPPPCPNPNVEHIRLRSGQFNGMPGTPCQIDTAVTYAPSSPPLAGPLTLTPALFTAAEGGANAQVIIPSYSPPPWSSTLPADSLARWIDYQADSSCGYVAGSVLYAHSFIVNSRSICTAELDFCWLVDNSLGEPGATPPVVGLYVGPANSSNPPTPLPVVGGTYTAQMCQLSVAIPPNALSQGLNVLWIYQYNGPPLIQANPSGVIYTAGITICPCDCPCNTCVPSDIAENEPCNPTVSLNGGCDSVPAAFQHIECGSTICGTFWALGGFRDTDWYSFSLATTSHVKWEVCADTSVATFLIDGSTCVNVQDAILATGVGNCPRIAEADLCPGTYWAFVAPGQFNGLPCSQVYRATLTCTPPPVSLDCCGSLQSGSCFTVHPTPNCDNVACCEWVCGQDFHCCQVAWDALCVQRALMRDACDPLYCPDGQAPNVYFCEAGCRDDFDLSNGPELASGSLASPPCVDFDVIPNTDCFIHTFTDCWPSCRAGFGPNSCGTILAAFLEIRLNLGPQEIPDFTDIVDLLDQGTPVGGTGPFGFPALGTITLDLSTLPFGGDILSTLYDGELGVRVYDDTGVDYLALTVIHCPCKDQFRPEIKLDDDVDFSTPSPTTPRPELIGATSGLCTGFPPQLLFYDMPANNQCFIETIALSAFPCITGGYLEIGVVPTSGELWSNDSLSLELKGEFECGAPSFAWGMLFSNLPPTAIDHPWNGQPAVVMLDLGDLPPAGNGVRDIVSHLLNGSLDIYIQDDTGVSYIKFSPTVCECPMMPGDCCGCNSGPPGCDDPACEVAVCAIDPFCCDIAWDMKCCELVKLICGDPCGSLLVPGDLNGDGVVDGGDLGILLGAWGLCPVRGDAPCLADLDGNGVVDGGDIGILLGYWSAGTP